MLLAVVDEDIHRAPVERDGPLARVFASFCQTTTPSATVTVSWVLTRLAWRSTSGQSSASTSARHSSHVLFRAIFGRPSRQGILSECGSVSQHGTGIRDADIRHAVRNAMRWVDVDDNLTMLIGPAADGALLEIGVLEIVGEDPVVIHAMRLRPKFYRFLA